MILNFRKIIPNETILFKKVELDCWDIDFILHQTDIDELKFIEYENRWWVVVIDKFNEDESQWYDVYHTTDYYNYYVEGNHIDPNNPKTYPKRGSEFFKELQVKMKYNKRLDLINSIE